MVAHMKNADYGTEAVAAWHRHEYIAMTYHAPRTFQKENADQWLRVKARGLA